MRERKLENSFLKKHAVNHSTTRRWLFLHNSLLDDAPSDACQYHFIQTTVTIQEHLIFCPIVPTQVAQVHGFIVLNKQVRADSEPETLLDSYRLEVLLVFSTHMKS